MNERSSQPALQPQIPTVFLPLCWTWEFQGVLVSNTDDVLEAILSGLLFASSP